MLQFFLQSQRNKYEIKSRRLRSQTLTCFIFFMFSKKNHGFLEEDNPSEKAVIIEEELNCVDIDDIGNLEDLPRFVFIEEACGNLKVVNDGVELTRNINQKKSGVSQKPVDVHSVKNVGESIFSNNHVQYCESVK